MCMYLYIYVYIYIHRESLQEWSRMFVSTLESKNGELARMAADAYFVGVLKAYIFSSPPAA